jgi:hypothetical protein
VEEVYEANIVELKMEFSDNRKPDVAKPFGLSRVQKATVLLRQLLGLFLALGIAGLGLALLWIVFKIVLWIFRTF